MKSKKHSVVLVSGMGLGILKKQYAHHAIVELNDGKHKWEIVLNNDEYDIVDDINIGYEEIE